MVDGVSGRPGYFDAQPAALQRIQLDSARSMGVYFEEKNVPQISCEQLSKITRPVLIVRGERSRPFFTVMADAAARCWVEANSS
ncbi:hypothetical protein WKW80_32505 [Variovorax humicola]|uniref:Uncharacterized protein n=1 Tax=Variovorax humicola TaxID=1769758 RepID=A0ABU8WAY0_9BURK